MPHVSLEEEQLEYLVFMISIIVVIEARKDALFCSLVLEC